MEVITQQVLSQLPKLKTDVRAKYQNIERRTLTLLLLGYQIVTFHQNWNLL